MLSGKEEPPDWLLTSRITDLLQCKIRYTGILAELIMENCKKNSIITEEQEAGKRGG